MNTLFSDINYLYGQDLYILDRDHSVSLTSTSICDRAVQALRVWIRGFILGAAFYNAK